VEDNAITEAVRALTARLVPLMKEAWDTDGVGTFDIDGGGYVQWGKWPEGMQTECNAGAVGAEPTFLQRRMIAELGFTMAEDSGHPNPLRRFASADQLPAEAEILARAAVLVHGWGLPADTSQVLPPILVAPLLSASAELLRLTVLALIDALADRGPVAVVDVFTEDGVLSLEQFPSVSPAEVTGNRLADRVVVVSGFEFAPALETRLRTAADVVACVDMLEDEPRSVILVGSALTSEALWLFRNVGQQLSQQIVLVADAAELGFMWCDDLALDFLSGSQEALDGQAAAPDSLLVLDTTRGNAPDSQSIGYADARVELPPTWQDNSTLSRALIQEAVTRWLPEFSSDADERTPEDRDAGPEKLLHAASSASPPPPSLEGSARQSVADLWDDVVARWLDRDSALPDDLVRWRASYTGAVDDRWYPDPFVGDLRGESGEPRVVVLGLNPGVGYAELQSRDGIWARRIRQHGYSRCLDRVAYDDPDWLRLHGRNSPYWAALMRFARRWTREPELATPQVLNLELYPWHSDRVEGNLRPPADLLDRYVWQPLSEVDVPHIFAFGSRWFDICTAMDWPLLHRYGPQHECVPGSDASWWNLAIFLMPSGQHAVVSWQPGFAGPPGAARVEPLRDLLTQRSSATSAPEGVARSDRTGGACYVILTSVEGVDGGPVAVLADDRSTEYIDADGRAWLSHERTLQVAARLQRSPTTAREWLSTALVNIGMYWQFGAVQTASSLDEARNAALVEMANILPPVEQPPESRAQRVARQAAAMYEWSRLYPEAAAGEVNDPEADLALHQMMLPPIDPEKPHPWTPIAVDETVCGFCDQLPDHPLHRSAN
jgi:hypothetical protein